MAPLPPGGFINGTPTIVYFLIAHCVKFSIDASFFYTYLYLFSILFPHWWLILYKIAIREKCRVADMFYAMSIFSCALFTFLCTRALSYHHVRRTRSNSYRDMIINREEGGLCTLCLLGRGKSLLMTYYKMS